MILEQHYADEVLIAFLHDDSAARRDPHLAHCRPCGETLDTLRTMSDALEAEAVWELGELDETPRQETIDVLRAKQREMAADSNAAMQVKQVLVGPRERWAETLEAHPDWQTAGMVRALVAEAERRITVAPPDALEIAKLSVNVARRLRGDKVSVAALREYAFALYLTGQYGAALDVTKEAEQVLVQVGASEVDAARVRLQQALILADCGQDENALALATDAAAVFAFAKDDTRHIAAVRTQGIALYHLRRNREAISLYSSVFDKCSSLDRAAFAGLLQNMALCYREIGDFANATRFFLQALDAFQRLGSSVGIAKTRWHLGRTFLAEGKAAEALSLLTQVRQEFEELTLVQDVALVTIDIAQALMAMGKPDDVAKLCRAASEYFASANLLNTEGAQVAIALIREAAAAGRLSETVLVNARARVEPKPKLLFAPAS